jgi:hypothetical protein
MESRTSWNVRGWYLRQRSIIIKKKSSVPTDIGTAIIAGPGPWPCAWLCPAGGVGLASLAGAGAGAGNAAGVVEAKIGKVLVAEVERVVPPAVVDVTPAGSTGVATLVVIDILCEAVELVTLEAELGVAGLNGSPGQTVRLGSLKVTHDIGSDVLSLVGMLDGQ